MGISGWVSGNRVLIGNRLLMKIRGCCIALPDGNLERRLCKYGQHAVYLATRGSLSAMFVVSYQADEKIVEALQKAVDNGLGIAVYSCDPNVTPEMLDQLFGVSKNAVSGRWGRRGGTHYQEATAAEDQCDASLARYGRRGKSGGRAMRLPKPIPFYTVGEGNPDHLMGAGSRAVSAADFSQGAESAEHWSRAGLSGNQHCFDPAAPRLFPKPMIGRRDWRCNPSVNGGCAHRRWHGIKTDDCSQTTQIMRTLFIHVHSKRAKASASALLLASIIKIFVKHRDTR